MAITPSAVGASRSASSPTRVVRWAARMTEIGLVAFLAFIAAQALWFLLYGDSVRPLDLDAGAGAGGVEAARVSDLSSLSGAGLFAARGGVETQALQVVPETRLNLVLRGVRRGGDPRSGAAFIEVPGEGQRALGVGDEITDQVILEEIYDDRVIINRRGARESLFLSEEAARRAQSRAAPAASSAPAPAVQPAGEASPLSGEPVLSLARELDPEDWIEGLRLAPRLEQGLITGFRVRDSSHLDVLRAAGLRPGDIVTALNGERLNSPDAAARALALFETTDRIALTVLRDGESVQIDIPLN